MLFQWADISSKQNIDLIDTITTGKRRNEIVNQLFNDMFSDNPHAAYLNINRQEKNKINNIIDFPLQIQGIY